MIIEGNVSVKAAVLGGKRQVSGIFLDETKNDRDTAFIIHRAEERQIAVHRVPRETIDKMASGRTHGGLIAEAGGRIYQTKEECMTEAPFLALVEGVEDPFNLGYIMRTLYSAGCDGLLLRKRNWENAESVIIRSSAGASEYLNVVMSEDLSADLRWFRRQGVRCYAAMRKDAVPYYDADLKRPVLIAVGGEMRGLSSSVRNEIPDNIYIPYANDFRNALNAAAATAVLAFEVMRRNV